MNFRYVAKLLGMLIAFISATMVFSIPWSVAAGETAMTGAFLALIFLGRLHDRAIGKLLSDSCLDR